MAMTFEYETTQTINAIVISWMSDASGNASGTTRKIGGFLERGVTCPGTPPPDDEYNVVITDEDGINVFTSCNKNLLARSTSEDQEVYFMIPPNGPPCINSKLTVTIDGAGNSTMGVIKLFWCQGAR